MTKGDRLLEVVHTLPDEAREVLLLHVEHGTPASWLADWLARWGSPVSATTIKEYRRRKV